MNAWRWIKRSLWFHRRAHLGTIIGTCASSAAIAGALLAGSAAKESLGDLAAVRLGNVEIVAQTGRRLVRQTLAIDLAHRTGGTFAPVLVMRATASSASGQPIAIQLIGVDKSFWKLGDLRAAPVMTGDGAWPNERAAKRIGARPGDWITLRAVRDEGIAPEAPLAPSPAGAVPTKLAIAGITPRTAMGEFALEHNVAPPDNVFVPLEWLQRNFGLPGRVNLILGRSCDVDRATAALRDSWQIADAGLELRHVAATGELELRSREIFIPQAIEASVTREEPGARGVLTYIVNRIAVGDKAAPYAVVSALEPDVAGPFPPNAPPGSIILNEWLGEDLGAAAGSDVTLSYYAPDNGRRLVERTAKFKVAGIVPISGRAQDPELLPDFPGLAAAKDCRSWDPGFDIDLSKIRDKDEAYWDRYRGAPKAFVSLKDGQGLWGSRFGKLTAIRFQPQDADALRSRLSRAIGPESLGVNFRDAKTDAMAAAKGSVDFAGLFVGFNVFLIVSASLLTALLFAFNVENRRPQAGALMALGWRRRSVRRLLVGEGAILAIIGMLPGIILGIAYMAGAISALNRIWRSTLDAEPLGFHVSPTMAIMGVLVGVLLSCATIAWTSRGLLRGPIRALLAGEYHDGAGGRHNRTLWIAAAMLGIAVAGVALLMPEAGDGEGRAMRFFGAGAALLLAFTGAAAAWLRRPADRHANTSHGVGPWHLAWLGIVRRPGRSTATVVLLASGIFMVASSGAHRRDPLAGADRRDSGTGGFALLAEGPVALADDPRDKDAMLALGISEQIAAKLRSVPGRVRDGDDASCLNPAKVQSPRLLGIDPGELESRQAFRITRSKDPAESRGGWHLLNTTTDKNIVPAIADESTAIWALGIGVGDRLPMTDALGRPFEVEIVALAAPSILQGWLIISESNFLERYPDASGYRLMLIDSPKEFQDAAQKEFGRALADLGWQVRPSVARLADLMAVEHTYLGIFQIAGGLGVLLGTAGLGAVLLRNIQERRREFAMLRAIGFSRDAVRRIIMNEHMLLLALGMFCGVAPALLASWPALAASGGNLPLLGLGATLAGVAVVGLLAIRLATRGALGGNLLAALRNE